MEPPIEIPRDLTDKRLIPFFQGWKWKRRPMGLVTLDFRRVDFISPWAIALFSAYALWIREGARRKVRILLDENTVAGHYLCQVGFRELLGEAIQNSVERNLERTAGLTRIRKSSEIPEFVTRVMQLLRLEDAELGGAVRYSLVELLRNVVQHSQSPIGGVAMAQYFPNTGLVELVVVDVGVGIKSTLQTKYSEIDNDLKALKFATQPHVSGTFAPGAYNAMKDNAGLGLFFIKQIVSLSSGSMHLATGKFIGDIWGDPEGRQHKKYERATNKGGWNGTFAVLQLRRDTIGDFDSVLSTCREMAEEARKDPSKIALDFLDEIPELKDIVIVKVTEFEENVEKAASIRDSIIEPTLRSGKLVVIDFSGISFATQSFVHALLYKIIKDNMQIASGLSIANCTDSTREAILAVAGYARVKNVEPPKNWNM